MKTKLILAFLFFLTIQKTAFSQNKDIEISVDKFLRLNYDFNQVIPDQKYFKIIDYISNLINEQKIPNNYHVCWQVEYLKCEKENDPLIEYKRLDFLLNYIETKHNIKTKSPLHLLRQFAALVSVKTSKKETPIFSDRGL